MTQIFQKTGKKVKNNSKRAEFDIVMDVCLHMKKGLFLIKV